MEIRRHVVKMPRGLPQGERVRVVVTGGAGYIGSTVTAYLLLLGFDVTVFDRFLFGAESVLAFMSHPRARIIRGDVRDTETLVKAVTGADAIIHLGAIVGEQACTLDAEEAYSVNFKGTKTLLAVANRCGVRRFVFSSTCSNYGVSAPDALADEDTPLKPLSEYARSKMDAESVILDNTTTMAATVLRFGTVCGLSPRMRFDLLVNDIARAAALGQPIRIFAPDAWRPYLHVRDVARHIYLWLNMDQPERMAGRVFNVVGENLQKKELIELVRRHFPKASIQVTEHGPDLRDYRVSSQGIRDEFGFHTLFTVEDAFVETATAVSGGVFRNPSWTGYSAIPDSTSPFWQV